MIRQQGLGAMSENGERFADVCVVNDTDFGGSISPYKRIHEETWIFPDFETANQIGHEHISKMFRRTLPDVSHTGRRCWLRPTDISFSDESQVV